MIHPTFRNEKWTQVNKGVWFGANNVLGLYIFVFLSEQNISWLHLRYLKNTRKGARLYHMNNMTPNNQINLETSLILHFDINKVLFL